MKRMIQKLAMVVAIIATPILLSAQSGKQVEYSFTSTGNYLDLNAIVASLEYSSSENAKVKQNILANEIQTLIKSSTNQKFLLPKAQSFTVNAVNAQEKVQAIGSGGIASFSEQGKFWVVELNSKVTQKELTDFLKIIGY